MRRLLYVFGLMVLFVVMSAALKSPRSPQYVDGEVLVKFKASLSAQSQTSIVSGMGARVRSRLSSIGVQRLQLRRDMTVHSAIEQLYKSGQVLYAEPNYIVRASIIPNDAQFVQQWGLRNTGQTGGLAGADIKAAAAWDVITGTTAVIIGILDSGLDYRHADLRNNLYTNPGEDPWSDPNDPTTGNKIDDDGNGLVDDWKGYNFFANSNDVYDDNGHGTHVAGIAGAVGNNGQGVAGVCWQVRILPLKTLNAVGDGSVGDAIEAVEYAADRGVDILNCSWGGPDYSEALRDMMAYAGGQGMLIVAAAGNRGVNTDNSPEYPACFDLTPILSVAASDAGDQRAVWGEEGGTTDDCGFSCTNAVAAVPGSNFGVKTVDLAAPGKYILSTVPGGYAVFSGTSMSAPYVSGAAALVLARNPGFTPDQLKQRLMNTVDAVSAFNGLCVTGGRLNLHRAVTGS